MMDEKNAPEGSLTRIELREAAYRAVPSISREDGRNLVDATLEELTEALLRGETVKLIAFGIFKVRSQRERVGRNPMTGIEAKITPRRVVTFKASPLLLERMNGNKPHVWLRDRLEAKGPVSDLGSEDGQGGGRVARPFGFALTDPGMRLSRTRLFPEVTRIRPSVASRDE